MLASIKVDRRGNVTKIKKVDFASTSTDASTKVTPAASVPSSSVTLDQVQLAERDVHWAIWLNSKDRESTGKESEIADEPPSVSTVATSEFYVPQPSIASLVNQP